MKCDRLVFDEMTREQASQILGVSPSASQDAIRSAYKELVQVWHPDRFAAGPESLKLRAHSQMVLLNEAYQYLKLRPSDFSEDTAHGKSSSSGQTNQDAKSEHANRDSYDSDFLRLRQQAEHGDVDAQFNLGFRYYKGNGVPMDAAQAVFWWRKAAEQGDESAQVNLGIMYKQGKGVPMDAAQAVFWYRRAAEKGNKFAQCNLGAMYDDGHGVSKDAAEAVRWYLKAAEQGHAVAQYNLAVMLKEGVGVPKDAAEAARWCLKAAEQGHAAAQYNLAVMLTEGRTWRAAMTGEGIPKDPVKAIFWLRKAAEQGHAAAQGWLGRLYFLGEYVPKDPVMAFMWLMLGAPQGAEIDRLAMKALEYRMTPAQIAEAQRLDLLPENRTSLN